MMTRVTAVNTRLARLVTDAVGTMWAAYVFLLLTLISLPAALSSGNPLVIVAWIAQTFLQLVLLPIIMVGQSVTQGRTEAVIQDTHDHVAELLAELHGTLNLTVEKHAETHALVASVLADRDTPGPA
jgi:hypothetical protein